MANTGLYLMTFSGKIDIVLSCTPVIISMQSLVSIEQQSPRRPCDIILIDIHGNNAILSTGEANIYFP